MTTIHDIQSRMLRNNYLKDLFVQWRGLTAAYDEGLMRGDAVLASAVWRNVLKAEENFDLQKLAEVVAYMRSALMQLEKMEDETITQGDVVFGDPGAEASLVKVRSRMMDKRFDEVVDKAKLTEGKTISTQGIQKAIGAQSAA
jgi:cytochrome b pre-mRNA-processing protein 3